VVKTVVPRNWKTGEERKKSATASK
jgi:hypothetical protein